MESPKEVVQLTAHFLVMQPSPLPTPKRRHNTTFTDYKDPFSCWHEPCQNETWLDVIALMFLNLHAVTKLVTQTCSNSKSLLLEPSKSQPRWFLLHPSDKTFTQAPIAHQSSKARNITCLFISINGSEEMSSSNWNLNNSRSVLLTQRLCESPDEQESMRAFFNWIALIDNSKWEVCTYLLVKDRLYDTR